MAREFFNSLLNPIPDVLLAAIDGHNDHHDDPEQDLERRRINVQAVEEQGELSEDQRPKDCSPVVPAPPCRVVPPKTTQTIVWNRKGSPMVIEP